MFLQSKFTSNIATHAYTVLYMETTTTWYFCQSLLPAMQPESEVGECNMYGPVPIAAHGTTRV